MWLSVADSPKANQKPTTTKPQNRKNHEFLDKQMTLISGQCSIFNYFMVELVNGLAGPLHHTQTLPGQGFL